MRIAHYFYENIFSISFLFFFPKSLFADYTVTSLGSLVSKNEELVDAAKVNYDSLIPTGLNINGEVSGYSTHWPKDKNGRIIGAPNYRAYRWKRDGRIREIKIPGAKSTQVVAINDRGKIVVFSEDKNGVKALHVGLGRLKRVDDKSKGVIFGNSPISSYDLNNRGEIVINEGGMYSPKSGWKQLEREIDCELCDARAKAQISDSGQVISSIGNSFPYLISSQKQPIKVSCLAPRNEKIRNINNYVNEFRIGFSNPIFLKDDAILVNGYLNDEEFQSQLFLFERRDSKETINDYCPILSITKNSKECQAADTSVNDKELICSGEFTLKSADGHLEGVKISLYAELYDLKTATECSPVLVDTYSTTKSQNQFSVKTHPDFNYYLAIGDPRFDYNPWSTTQYVRFAREEKDARCRKPFEE